MGSYGKLPALHELHLDRNELAALLESIGPLLAFQYLYLEGNKLAAPPSLFSNYKNPG